jgi:hypothetical protein
MSKVLITTVTIRRGFVALICAASAHVLSSGAAASQTGNYELIKIGSSSQASGNNQYSAYRIDHIRQKIFNCQAKVSNTLQVTGKCSLVASPTVLSGPNDRTIPAAPFGHDNGGNPNTVWQVDQLTGTTIFCYVFANTSKCIDVTPP